MIDHRAGLATHKMTDSTRSSAPDWLAIEADFRAGLLSLRAIAGKHGGVTEGAIRKRARKLDWSRDLTARIRAKARELVRSSTVRTVGAQYATGSEAVETAIVHSNAEVLAHVEITQRRNISRARSIVIGLFVELERTTGDGTVELIRDPSQVLPTSVHDERETPGAGGRAQNRAISLPARAATAKALADALRTLISLEREAWGMDDREPAPAAAARVIDSSKLTWEQRDQLRQMILRASADVSPAPAEQPQE